MDPPLFSQCLLLPHSVNCYKCVYPAVQLSSLGAFGGILGAFWEYLPSLPSWWVFLGFGSSPLPRWGWRGGAEPRRDGFGASSFLFFGAIYLLFLFLHQPGAGWTPWECWSIPPCSHPGAELAFGLNSLIFSPLSPPGSRRARG